MHRSQLTKGMATAQLRLLRIFALQFRPDGVQQLQVTLLRPFLLRFDECPAQGPACLAVLEGIRPILVSSHNPKHITEYLRGLCVFRSRKHHHVGRRGLCHDRALAGLPSIGRLLEKADGSGRYTGQITLSIGVDDTEKILGGFLGQIGLLEDTLG